MHDDRAANDRLMTGVGRGRAGAPAETRGSKIAFRQAADKRRRADPLAQARILVSSVGLGWRGILAEVGDHQPVGVDDVVVPGHLLSVNLDGDVFPFEKRGSHGFRPVAMPPSQLMLLPAAEPFTHRVGPTRHVYGAVVLDVARVRALTGAPDASLRPRVGWEDVELAYLVRAVVAEAKAGNPCGVEYVDALFTAISLRLYRGDKLLRDGSRSPARVFTRPGLRRTLDFIEAHLGEPLHVEALASVAGVSPAHFAREFKRATGEAPHSRILRRRLECSRDAVVAGRATLTDIAAAFGFSDQAHWTRMFRRQFGVTPGALRAERVVAPSRADK